MGTRISVKYLSCKLSIPSLLASIKIDLLILGNRLSGKYFFILIIKSLIYLVFSYLIIY